MQAQRQLLVAVGFLAVATLYLLGARSLPASPGEPGPGFFPTILGLALAALALVLAWEARGALGRAWRTGTPAERVIELRPVLAGVLTGAYVWLLYRVGFAVSTALYAASLAALLSPRQPWRWIAVAAVTTLAIRLLFEAALGVLLP